MNNEIEDMLRSTQPVERSHDLRSKVLDNAAARWDNGEIEESLIKCSLLKPMNGLQDITLEVARQEWRQSSPFRVSIPWLLSTAATLAFAFIGSSYDSRQNQMLESGIKAPATTAEVQKDHPQALLPSTELTTEIGMLVGSGLLANHDERFSNITWFQMRSR
jgi:hypothetical protein